MGPGNERKVTLADVLFGNVSHEGTLTIKPSAARIIRSGIATIVFWDDGTKTIVKRSSDAQDDPYAAFCAALAKKVYGSNSAVKRILERKTVVKETIEKPEAKAGSKETSLAWLKMMMETAGLSWDDVKSEIPFI